MKLSNLPQIITILFLFLLIVAGSYQIFSLQQRYGWTYYQVTIINGEETGAWINLNNQAMSLLFLLWIIFLLLPKKESAI